MINQIQEINFPSYATLSSATVALSDMGDRTITAQVKIDGAVVPDFSFDWEVEFQGERYIHPVREPQASKGNDSICSVIDLTFQHWTIYQLRRYFFVEMTTTESGTAMADKYIASLSTNLKAFCDAFQRVLDYYYDGEITIDLNPDWEYSEEVSYIDISYTHIWDVLQKIYEVYGVRWTIEGTTIKVGYPTEEVSHIFEYGFEGGLLKVERQVQSTDIRNSLLGRGSDNNLPYLYFKDFDKYGETGENGDWNPDPDAIPELRSIYFTELRGKTFRDYVQGWKTNPNRDLSYGDEVEEYDEERGESEDGWAYKAGHTDEKFNPIEYVEDKESIEKYGLLQGGLENQEDIYPSIQGVEVDHYGRIDEIVDVEEILTDDVTTKERFEIESDISAYMDMTDTYLNGASGPNISISDGGTINVRITSPTFTVPHDYSLCITDFKPIFIPYEYGPSVYPYNIILNPGCDIKVFENGTINEVDIANIVQGSYYYVCYASFSLEDVNDDLHFCSGQVFCIDVKVVVKGVIEKPSPFKDTFDIWVKNLWDTTRNAVESDEAYAERVWRPILGDREGNEAKVCFSTGLLSGHDSYEFTIVKGGVHYDNSKSLNGVQSEWRLTLAKSDAELDATDKYLPNTQINANAGDHFFFIGVDMPHQYVLWAEEKLDNYKKNQLLETANIKPTWVVQTDKVRLNQLQDGETEPLINALKVGNSIRLADTRFISGAYENLYLQSVTYSWDAQTILSPNVEVVLSDKIATSLNPVAQLQGEVDVLAKQVGSISNMQQLVRAVGDKIYLRKDGIDDISLSPTSFNARVSQTGFMQGLISGQGWGIYQDAHGNWIGEFDQLNVRQEFHVNTVVAHQTTYVGGKEINSAAFIVCSNVIDDGTSYICYFDEKKGSVMNLFQVNDVAYSQKFDAENIETEFYKRRVNAIKSNYISLSKTDVDGSGVPAIGDVIIQYGNYTIASRQYVIIRDVIGGGYERMLSDLNSVTATGTEYYFAGRLDGGTPRWFVGDAEGDYAEWKDGALNIRGKLAIGSDVGGTTVVEGGLVTAETIALGSSENIKAGITGVGEDDSDVRIWAGATKENMNGAPFKVSQDGTLYSSKANIEGTIIAKAGYLGGFEINDGKIGYGSSSPDDQTNGLTLINDFIRFSNDTQRTIIGTINTFGYTYNAEFSLSGDNGDAVVINRTGYDPYLEPLMCPRALNITGNSLMVGKLAVFETGYIGPVTSDAIVNHFPLTHKFHFTLNSGNTNVYLPTKEQVVSVVGSEPVFFDIWIVCDVLMSNEILLLPKEESQIFNNNAEVIPSIGMGKGDSISLRYYDDRYMILNDQR